MGSSLAVHLRRTEPDNRVIALDNLKRRGSELNIPRLAAVGVEFVHGDVREPSDLLGLPKTDVLIDCSAEPSVMAGTTSPPHYVVDTNLRGTLNCLDLVVRDKATFLFISTSRVYPIAGLEALSLQEEGDRFIIPKGFTSTGVSEKGIAEDFPLDGARTLYGTTKLASEMLIQEYAETFGFPYLVNRCGVLSGPWQMGKTDQGFLLLWLARHHWKKPLSYIGFGGAGKQVRDVLHIDDLCDLVSIQLARMPELSGSIFNAGGGHANSTSLKELTRSCEEITGNSINVGRDPDTRPGDVRYYVTDNTRVAERLDWRPTRSLETTARDAYVWLTEHEEQLARIMG